jgi:Peptidase family C25
MKRATYACLLAGVMLLFAAPAGAEAYGYDYLIITNDTFYTAVLPLATHYSAGMTVKVVKLSTIGTGPSAADITTYIKSEYNAASPKPKYLLLVGDIQFLPTHYVTAHNPEDDGLIATDLYYGDMSGNYLPELYVGRFPVNSVAETTTMVNKAIAYEALSSRILLFGANPEMSYAVTHDTTILSPASYIVDRVADAAATSTEIINRIKTGRLVAAYYGHGSTTGMGWLSTSDVTPANFTNAQLPIIASGGCFNGEFDHSTATSIGEALVLTQKGAIAFVGSTRTGGYGYAYKFLDGFYSSLAKNGTVGKMLNDGRLSAYSAALAAGQPVGAGSWTKSFIEKINLLGDPAIYPTVTVYICFIDKALGSDSLATNALRTFRDKVIAPLPTGPEWIQRYYETSTAIMKWIDP